MKKILEIFKIKKDDKYIFYKGLLIFLAFGFIWNISESTFNNLKSSIQESRKEDILLEVNSINETSNSMNIIFKTNLPSGTNISFRAEPVESLLQYGYFKSGYGVAGDGVVSDNTLNIDFNRTSMDIKASEFYIVNTPYRLIATIYCNDEGQYNKLKSNYKESNLVEFKSINNTDIVEIQVGEVDIKNGLTIDEYISFVNLNQSNNKKEQYNKYMNEHVFEDISNVKYNDDNYEIMSNKRVTAQGTILYVYEENTSENDDLHIFIELDNGGILDVRWSKSNVNTIYNDTDDIVNFDIDSVEIGSKVKIYGFGLRTTDYAYTSSGSVKTNTSVINTSKVDYVAHEYPNLRADYIQFIDVGNAVEENTDFKSKLNSDMNKIVKKLNENGYSEYLIYEAIMEEDKLILYSKLDTGTDKNMEEYTDAFRSELFNLMYEGEGINISIVEQFGNEIYFSEIE